jgi:hypothetical protein
MRNIYILISTTPTKFGALIRCVGKVKYNHAAIALDKDLKHLYAFARGKHSNLLSGRLVKESLSRYTLRFRYKVDCIVFEIPVTNHEYNTIKALISEIYQDKTYIYNLFSVLSFPILHGFSTYNAFSCIEFVMFILKYLTNTPVPDKAPCHYTPDELTTVLNDYIVYSGDLKTYMMTATSAASADTESVQPDDYFSPLTIQDVRTNISVVYQLFYRLVSKIGKHSAY